MIVRTLLTVLVVGGALGLTAQDKAKTSSQADSLTYSQNVAPLIKKYCLPCHSADNDNSSELILDSYDTMLQGGKHGVPLTAGNPDESNLYLKLLTNPPFGRQMPRGKGPKPGEDDIKMIHDWIVQGAKK